MGTISEGPSPGGEGRLGDITTRRLKLQPEDLNYNQGSYDPCIHSRLQLKMDSFWPTPEQILYQLNVEREL